MTLDQLRSLRPGDGVVRDRAGHPPVFGRVCAADAKAVEIYWPDGTSSLIWFAHAADGFDPRHALIDLPTTQKGTSLGM